MLIFLSLLLIILIIVVELSRPKAVAFDTLSVFSFFFLLYYPIATINMLIFPDLLTLRIAYTYSYAPQITPWVVIFQWVYYWVFAGAYLLAGRMPHVIPPPVKPELNTIVRLLVPGFAMIAIAFFLWSLAYGGPISAMAQGDLIRENVIERDTSWSFMARFYTPVFFLSAVLFFAFVNRRWMTATVRTLSYVLIPIASALLLIVTLTSAGRASLIFFAITCLAVILWVPISIKPIALIISRWKMLLTTISISALFLIFGNPIFASLQALYNGPSAFVEEVMFRIMDKSKITHSYYLDFSSNFMHYAFSIDAALHSTNYFSFDDITLGKEVPDAIISLAPYRLTGRHPILTLQDRNNLVINPRRYTEKVVGGSIPPGAIANSIYMFGMAGPLILPLILGVLAKRIDSVILNRLRNCGSLPMFYATWLLIAYPVYLAFEPHMFILGGTANFTIWLGFFFIAYKKTRYNPAGPAMMPPRPYRH